jgi:hypothetical protein
VQSDKLKRPLFSRCVEGVLVGDVEGSMVGMLLSDLVGDSLGDLMGEVVGDLEGRFVCGKVGDLAGSTVGGLVGDSPSCTGALAGPPNEAKMFGAVEALPMGAATGGACGAGLSALHFPQGHCLTPKRNARVMSVRSLMIR